jgi:CPA1 family monovalent cation:H+ antiporter
MQIFSLIAILLVLSAAFSYLNYRFLKLPTTIGLMALTLVFSVAVIAVGQLFPAVEAQAAAVVRQVDLGRALLHGMLGFLLFAGALHLELADLARFKVTIITLATVGVVLSTVFVGSLAWCLLGLLGIEARFIYCLLFGALISPTDPIAVLGLIHQAGAPKSLQIQIIGESLFNDGIGVVVFLALLGIATGRHGLESEYLTALLLREVAGGVLFGLTVGWLVYRLLKSVDNYQVEILLSLALVAGGYALADALQLSGPLAMVVAGLLIGNHGRKFAMSATTIQHIDLFWELVDGVLNAVLFVMLGLEVLVLKLNGKQLIAGLMMIPIVLAARWLSVGLPLAALSRWYPFERRALRILTWGGLRGGISVAMALSLPMQIQAVEVPERQVILVITYAVVAFSILVQGLTLGPLTRRWLQTSPAKGSEPFIKSF